jgi:hypothetical protein
MSILTLKWKKKATKEAMRYWAEAYFMSGRTYKFSQGFSFLIHTCASSRNATIDFLAEERAFPGRYGVQYMEIQGIPFNCVIDADETIFEERALVMLMLYRIWMNDDLIERRIRQRLLWMIEDEYIITEANEKAA